MNEGCVLFVILIWSLIFFVETCLIQNEHTYPGTQVLVRYLLQGNAKWESGSLKLQPYSAKNALNHTNNTLPTLFWLYDATRTSCKHTKTGKHGRKLQCNFDIIIHNYQLISYKQWHTLDELLYILAPSFTDRSHQKRNVQNIFT